MLAVSVNRRQFIKYSAKAITSYSLPDCSSAIGSNEYDERYGHSPNYYNGKFHNLIETSEGRKPGTFFEMLGEIVFGEQEREPNFELPVNQLGPSFFKSSPTTGLRAIWMGHSSVLIEIDGRRLLVDPVWSDRLGPPLVGRKRFHKSPIQIDSLPKLDAILISHEHNDHLDRDTILALAKRETKYYVPLGVGEHLKEWGIQAKRIVEMDWRDSTTLGGDDFTIMATPARHYPGRLFSSIPTC